jgi:hypothetical protein
MRFVYQVWQAYQRSAYPEITSPDALTLLGSAKPIRIGAWGDPASAPVELYESLFECCPNTTGYTSQWQKFPELKSFLMASVSSKAMAQKAWSMGWRTYRITPIDDLEPNERWCINQEDKEIQCVNCPTPCDGGKPTKWSIATLPSGRRRQALADKIAASIKTHTLKRLHQTLLLK